MTSDTTGIVVWRWEQAVIKPWDGVLLEVENRPKEFGALDLGKTLIHFSKKKNLMLLQEHLLLQIPLEVIVKKKKWGNVCCDNAQEKQCRVRKVYV